MEGLVIGLDLCEFYVLGEGEDMDISRSPLQKKG